MGRLNLVAFTDIGSNFDAKLSIRPNGMIGVSSGALKRFELLDGEYHVVLHYDAEAQIVGVRPTRNRDEPGAIKLIVRHPPKNSLQKQPSAHFSAKSFLQYHDIPFREERTRSYDAEWSDEYGMILFDLNKPRDVGRGKKANPGSEESPSRFPGEDEAPDDFSDPECPFS